MPKSRRDEVSEKHWLADRRDQVIAYLRGEGVDHGRVGEGPAWSLAPHVSIWAIESRRVPDSVGWWVICGDVPTDYVSADGIRHPRDALRAISERWLEAAAYMRKRKLHPTMRIGSPDTWDELAPLLKSRALTLRQFADDDGIWTDLPPSSARRRR